MTREYSHEEAAAKCLLIHENAEQERQRFEERGGGAISNTQY